MKTLRRIIHPTVKVVDDKKGLVQYVASDETLDSYREVIRADGWRFDNFRKNAPFVDSHDYSTIENQLGKVVDFKVEGKQLVETVQWAIDVPTNTLALKGFQMTQGGYLKAVSVGFWPEKMATKWDSDRTGYCSELAKDGLGMDGQNCPRCYYLQQQQVELSACIIGANPNALAKAYKAGVLTDDDMQMISSEFEKRINANDARESAAALLARQRKRGRFLEEFERAVRKF